MTAPRRSRTIPALTGLRGVAALWVVGFHLGPELTGAVPALAALRPLLDAGYLGVDLFFALSGYVLALRYGDEWRGGATGVVEYLRRRLARILPLHAAVLFTLTGGVALAGVLGFTRFAASPLWRPEAWLPQLLLVHAWGGQGPAWNVPSWSLSCEWLGYLALPWWLPLSQRLPLRAVRPVAAICVAVGLAAGLGLHGSWNLTHEGAVLRFVPSFAAGTLLARLPHHTPRHRAPLLVGAIGVTAMAGAPPALLVPLLVAFVAVLARDEGLVARGLAHPRMQRLGTLSFALYLVHEPVLLVTGTGAPPWLAEEPAFLLAQLAAIAAVTWGAATFVEEPARRWLLRRPRTRSFA